MRSTTRATSAEESRVPGAPAGALLRDVLRAGSDERAKEASFPASLDGSLKEWVGPRTTVLHRSRRPSADVR
jgi:hypothetical protein